jgi:hypothetical protein
LNVARDYKVETYDQNALKKDAPSKNPNSGVVEDPTPSPNSRLSITLPVPKRN